MIGVSKIVALGVITPAPVSTSGGGVNNGITVAQIVTETFVYQGNNEFVLADPAIKVLDVFIDQGTFPNQVPAFATNSVTIDPTLLFDNVNVTIKYIKA